MITSLLIANRGEIACRIIRTARRLGVRTIAVYSEADAKALHVRDADQAMLIGPAAAKDSYLKGDVIIAAAKRAGAEAIHPGYGFLSENAEFAQAVIDAGIIWVGPPPAAILAMGLKDAAKARMIEAGVPVTPGYLGEDQSDARLQTEADAIGYPLLIKAVAGGGGKGMRKVEKAADFAAALTSARREAAASFGDDRVLLEVYVTRPRHIEVQVFADKHGKAVHLYERDCSLQRRHQKVIEEAPAPGMTPEVREAICGAAVKAAKAIAYEGAGTIEFIADGSQGLRADRIWFMEMNTRLQVEHPVTEAITGQDLVEWQLRVASGEPLPLAQADIPLNGWAMEARLYAENPAKNFLPSTGPLKRMRGPRVPIRIDTGVEEGGAVTPWYDPMIAKFVTHGATRAEAAGKLARACRDIEIFPVKTNTVFLANCLEHPAFLAGEIDTGFIDAHRDELVRSAPLSDGNLRAGAAQLAHGPHKTGLTGAWAPRTGPTGFRLNGAPQTALKVLVDGEPRELTLNSTDFGRTGGTFDGPDLMVFENGGAFRLSLPREQAVNAHTAASGDIFSPMPGRIVAVEVADGAKVKKGDKLIVVEAMKMEHALTAPADGVVSGLSVKAGDQIEEGKLLAHVKPV